MSSQMPNMGPSSGEKSGRLLKLSRTTDGTAVFAPESDLRRAGRAHDVKEVDHTAVDERQEGLGVKPEHQHDDRERHQRDDLTRIDLRELSADCLEVMARAPLP